METKAGILMILNLLISAPLAVGITSLFTANQEIVGAMGLLAVWVGWAVVIGWSNSGKGLKEAIKRRGLSLS